MDSDRKFNVEILKEEIGSTGTALSGPIKVGDYVMINDPLDQLGEGDKFKHSGPYRVDSITGGGACVDKLGGKMCMLVMERFSKCQPPTDEWKVGDVLPEKWLCTNIPTYNRKNGEVYSSNNYRNNRTVDEVSDGWAQISDCSCWLAPKNQYPTYSGTTQVQAGKGISMTPVMPVSVQPVGWKIGDRWRHIDGTCGKSIVRQLANGLIEVDYGENGTNEVSVERINNIIKEGTWIIQPSGPTNSQVPVTLENARVGMRVVRGKDWDYRDQDTTNGGKGIGTIKTNPDSYGWVDVQWDGGINQCYQVKEQQDLYIHSSNNTSQTEGKQSIVNNNQTNQTNKEYEKDSISSKCTGNSQHTGTSLNLCRDQEAISTGQGRTGYSLRCDGQPELTTGKHCTNTKGYGYHEEV